MHKIASAMVFVNILLAVALWILAGQVGSAFFVAVAIVCIIATLAARRLFN